MRNRVHRPGRRGAAGGKRPDRREARRAAIGPPSPSPIASLERSRRLGHRWGAYPLTPSRPSVAQRLSVSLQPDDDVIQQIVTYAQETLGLDEPVAAGMPPPGQVAVDENIYLYGHGGTSTIEVEENNRFGRQSVDQLTALLAPRIPAHYTGTIFLIGCTTQPLVAGLGTALQLATGQDLTVLGTPEKLQTREDGGIVLRRAPANDNSASMRESVDMGRRYYGRIIRLRNAVREAQQAIGAAGDMPARIQAVLQVMTALEQLRDMNQEIGAGLDRLGPDELPPKLEGRRTGLQSVRDDLAELEEQRGQLVALLDQWLPLRHDPTNFGSAQEQGLADVMRQRLAQARGRLNECIEVLALFTNIADEVLQGVPFQLEMMGQPAPPALVEEEAGLGEAADLEDPEEEHQDENGGGGSGLMWLGGLGLGAIFVIGAILAWKRSGR